MTSYIASRLQLPSAFSRSLTACVYLGSGPILGVGDEARLLEHTWQSVVAPPDFFGLGLEAIPDGPIPMAMEGYSEIEYALEPDEMDF